MAQELDQQIERLEARLAREPGGRVFAPLADAYRESGDLERARGLVEEGLDRHPAYATGHVVAGRIYRERGEDPWAEAAFHRVLELDPENVVALRQLAELEESAGRGDQALVHYLTLYALQPGEPALAERIRALGGHVPETAAFEVEVGTAPATEEGFLDLDFHLEPTFGISEETAERAAGPEERAAADAGPQAGDVSFDFGEVTLTSGQTPSPGGLDLGPEAAGDLAELETAESGAAAEPTESVESWETIDLGGLGIEPERGAEEPPEEEVTLGGDLDLDRVVEGPEEVEVPEGPAAESAEVAEFSLEPEGPRAAEPEVEAPAASGPMAEAFEEAELEPVAGAEPLEAPEAEVVTQTMGELYAQQGLYDRAAAVYRRLLEADPENQRLRGRWSELEALAARIEEPAAPPHAFEAAVEGEPEAEQLEALEAFGPPEEPGVEVEEEAGRAAEGLAHVDLGAGFFEDATEVTGPEMVAHAGVEPTEAEAAEPAAAEPVTPHAADEDLFAEEPEPHRARGDEFDAFFADMVEVPAPGLELESGGPPGEAEELAVSAEAQAPEAEVVEPAEADLAVAEAGAGSAHEDAVEALAAQLATGPGETVELSTPFAWSPEAEPVEEDEGPPIRAYLEVLLSWEPAVPIEELAPEAGEGVESGAGAVRAQAPAEAPPEPPEAPAADVREVAAAEPEPWLRTPLKETSEAEARAEVAPAEEQPFPWELEAEPAVEAPQAHEAAPPGAAPERPRSEERAGREEPSRAGGDEEDDDLETFREWLKSLRQ